MWIFLSFRAPRGTTGAHGWTQGGLGSPASVCDCACARVRLCVCVCIVPGRAPWILRGAVTPRGRSPCPGLLLLRCGLVSCFIRPLGVRLRAQGDTGLLPASPSPPALSKFDSPRGQKQNLGMQWGPEGEYRDPLNHIPKRDDTCLRSPSSWQPLQQGAPSPGAQPSTVPPRAVGKGFGWCLEWGQGQRPHALWTAGFSCCHLSLAIS